MHGFAKAVNRENVWIRRDYSFDRESNRSFLQFVAQENTIDVTKQRFK